MPADGAFGGEAEFGIEVMQRLAVADDLLFQAAGQGAFPGELARAVEGDVISGRESLSGDRVRPPRRLAQAVNERLRPAVDLAGLGTEIGPRLGVEDTEQVRE